MTKTTDEAREALLWFAWFVRKSRGTIEEVTQRALEQNPYLRWDEREAAYQEGWTKAEAEYHQRLAAVRAEGLNVERLAMSLHADRLTTGQCVNTSKTAWRVHLSEAEHIATWYARLAKDAEPDYLTSREQRRLACVCGHPLVRHTEYGCIDCGTSERTTPQHNFTRRLAKDAER